MGLVEVLQKAFTIWIEQEKELVIAAVGSSCESPQSYLYMTHENSDFVRGKNVLDLLLEPLWLCTRMKQGGEGGGEARERYSTKAQLQA